MSNIKIGDTSNYVIFDITDNNQIDLSKKVYIVKTKELEQKIEQNTNRIIQDYIWVETNNQIPKDTGGTITLSSIGRKTFKCDGTIDNPDCFEIQTCSISKKPCYEFDNGKTIIYVNHFSGAFNTMTWTTNDDWNTGTHINTTNSTDNLILSGTNTTGNYLSNVLSTYNSILNVSATWNSTEPDENKNITINISADNGVSWITAVNATVYTSGGGINSGGKNLLFNAIFSTNNTSVSPQLHDLTFKYALNPCDGFSCDSGSLDTT
ncbi:hypothetical protein GQ473_06635, partial [archaeon]|nr:hypothetical protein [archaeon]